MMSRPVPTNRLKRIARDVRVLVIRSLWVAGMVLAGVRRKPASIVAIRRQNYRTQTRGMRLSMPESLRDRLRPKWLRIRRDGSGTA